MNRKVEERNIGRRYWLFAFVMLVLLLAMAQAMTAHAAPGDLDTTFGGNGVVMTDFSDGSDEASALAIQSDGKIVAVGYAYRNTPTFYDFALARYNTDGTLDTSFGGNGKVVTDFLDYTDYASAVAIQSNGKIVAAGSAADTSGDVDFALARYNTNGDLDASFGGNGKVTTGFGGSEAIYAMAVQSDGKIVVAGYSYANSDYDLIVARYNTNGTLDTTFGNNGRRITPFGGDDRAFALALQSNGKIVLAGFSVSPAGDSDFALARYTTAGDLDTGFDADGKVTTGFGGDDGAHAIAIQSDDRIVVAGFTSDTNGNDDFALARYNTNGNLDNSFGGNGKVTTGIAGFDTVRGVALQSDGKIVAGGYSSDPSGNSDFTLARYNPNGTLDTTFSDNGTLTTDFQGGPDQANALVIQPNGRLVLAGKAEGNTVNFGLARYMGGSAPPPTPAPTATLPVPVVCIPYQFTDVPTNHTFYPYVHCIACRGIDIGYACGGPGEPCDAQNNRYFRVNSLITRDQVARMVAGSAGFNDMLGPQIFEDVPPSNSAFYPSIQRMANRGLIGGYPCGGPGEPCVPPLNRPYYRPSANATRGQIAKIVSNGAGFNDPPPGQTFQDVPPSHTFYAWIERLATRGIMGGYPCGGSGEPCVPPQNRPYFRWANNATRGQVAKIAINTFQPNCPP
jgi:uncharacterized delta-60 repeat protein